MSVSVILATALSTVLIVLLCHGDPKRRRTAQLSGEGKSPTARRLLAALACVPGLALALNGDAAAFVIWLGSCAVAGWCIALWFGRSREGAS